MYFAQIYKHTHTYVYTHIINWVIYFFIAMLPQIWHLKITYMYYLTIPVSEESGQGLAESSALGTHEGVI
jgi:hypothetical protein